ncbi:plasmid stabilization system protein ParE [Arcicella aurantiaca]|uniref:Plasmid stabilization system protein ParE n=1 Tax=Arcicella aurantiaca TaxID=591202 RepID=A0A316DXM3_9BACT|nr:type II toxin-antitoxin system RelE/ParE family toxin [Arcicella aurantiaca]PWK22655.1 plasmid stabilization system protein ParE [Arcicella aurantiaca]
MAYEIIWSRESRENYKDIIDSLLKKWSFEVAEEFTNKIIERLTLLEMNPYLGTSHPEITSLRKLLIPPYNYLYYTTVNQQVILLNIVDSRRKIS